MPDWITPILLIALGLSLLGVVLGILQFSALSINAPRIRVQDASHLQVPPPLAIQSIVGSLTALGFSRLGEAGQEAYAQQAGPAQVWYFTDRSATTCAGAFAVGRAAVTVIYSWFGDEAVIVTAYPKGVQVEEPNFRYHTIATSVEDAYRHHVEQLPDFTMRFGQPRRLDNMSEIIRLDAIYNARFAQRRLRPSLWRDLSTPLFQVYLIGVLFGAFAALRVFALPSALVLIGVLALILPAVALFIWFKRRSRR